MTKLIKVGYWTEGARLNVVFIHGLGGNAYNTWRRAAVDNTFWPVWLAGDIAGLATWTLTYEASLTNWFGTAMPIQDRAKNVLECLLGSRELRGAPIVFVCHSMGGLIVKQALRAADGRRAYSLEAQALLESVKGVVFIATPHTGSMRATLLDKLRLIAWPSVSTLDLVRNNANLRDLNVWYRNWSGAIRHKVFYEKQGTAAGLIVGNDSSDPGILHVDPVGIDADHLGICKPADVSDLIYIRTRDFIADEIIPDVALNRGYGTFQACELPRLPHLRSSRFAPIALRLAIIAIVGLLLFKGTEALFFPPDALGRATVEQITEAMQAKSPNLTQTQIDRFINVLRDARGEPSFEHAVEEAKKGNTHVAEGIWRQIYENREKEQNKARREQADAARNLAATAITNNVAEGLSWYQKATALDPDNMQGWFGLGEAALVGGTLKDSGEAFHRYIELARRAGNERETAVGLTALGDVLVKQGKQDEALKHYRDGLAIRQGLAASDRHKRDLSVSYDKIGDVQVAQGKRDEALKSYQEALAIAEGLASDPKNHGAQRDLSVSYNKVADVLMRQGKLDESLRSYQKSLAIREKLADSDRNNKGWQRDLSVSYNKIGDVLMRQKNLDEPLRSYRQSLAIREQLAALDRRNRGWQADLAMSHYKVGDALVAQGKFDEALKSYRDSLAIREELAASDRSNTEWQNDLQQSTDRIVELAGQFLFDRNFARALEASDLTIKIAPDTIWLRTMRAYALMFLGRSDEARAAYLRYRGEQNVRHGAPWETVVLEDFDKLQKAGLDHPLMGEIKARFAVGR